MQAAKRAFLLLNRRTEFLPSIARDLPFARNVTGVLTSITWSLFIACHNLLEQHCARHIATAPRTFWACLKVGGFLYMADNHVDNKWSIKREGCKFLTSCSVQNDLDLEEALIWCLPSCYPNSVCVIIWENVSDTRIYLPEGQHYDQYRSWNHKTTGQLVAITKIRHLTTHLEEQEPLEARRYARRIKKSPEERNRSKGPNFKIVMMYEYCIFSDLLLLLRSLLLYWSIGLIFQFFYHFTDGRTPWTGEQLVAKPLPKHRTIQTQNKHIHTPNIHALCGIRTHDPGFRASEDSTCLTRRPLGYRDRHEYCKPFWNSFIRCAIW
jgi:hypothetical protein